MGLSKTECSCLGNWLLHWFSIIKDQLRQFHKTSDDKEVCVSLGDSLVWLLRHLKPSRGSTNGMGGALTKVIIKCPKAEN